MVTQNQKASLALARGFIVLIMPAVHSMWLYSSDTVKQGWMGKLLGFLAEGPGAQLFMLLMGVFIVLGRPKTNTQILNRALIIFLMGYALNVFKLVIPYYTGWIPLQFFTDNQFPVDAMLPINLLLIGDILQFAAIAYLACSLINKLQNPIIVTVILMLLVLITSPIFWEFSTNGFAGTKALSFFNGSPPYVFFPVFPWLFYPLSGLLGARVLEKYGSNTDVGILFGIVGWLLVLGGYYITQYEPSSWNLTFYRLGTGGTIMHGGIVLFWLALFLLLPVFVKNNFFFQFLIWLSKNITAIYLLQWIVVMWMLPVFGYNHLNISESILALIVTSIISFSIPYFTQKFYSKKKLNMDSSIIYDVAGIGIGPFNLGFAALCDPIKDLKTIFFEQKAEFGWHEGMMIPGTTLQVSYLADLVTLTDPASPYSYLNFLRKQNRLLQFGIHEQHYLSRSEYNRYCKWVCSQLDNLVFESRVTDIVFDVDQDVFKIAIRNYSGKPRIYYAKHIVVGTGTVPYLPAFIKQHSGKNVIHSSQYLKHKEVISKSSKVMLVGSGQSAAEIFYDLLNANKHSLQKLSWLTRSNHFYAMEHNKLAYEMSSPDYIDYFYTLEPAHRSIILLKQNPLYKGINYQLINAIYDHLYDNFIEGKSECVSIRTGLTISGILKKKSRLQINFTQNHTNKEYAEGADMLILATGYQYKFPFCLGGVRKMIKFDAANRLIVNRNYSVDKANRIFVQNAELHTHGFNAPDLGLGPYRNAIIINTILGYEYYPVDKKVAFQKFGLP